jgi:PTS system mannitol-specific IIC component
MAGVATFMITGAGTVASPAPGSIFAFFAVTAKGSHVGMILGVVIAAAVTFGVASLLLGFGRLKSDQEPDENPEGAADDAEASRKENA